MLPFLALVPWRWWLYGAIAAAAIGVVVYYHHQWVTDGYNAATKVITDANTASEKKADQGQQTVDGCYADGGDWDRVHGVCIPGSSK